MSWEMLGSSYLCANTWIETKDFNARFGVERGPRCTSIQLEAFAFPLPAAWKPLQQRPDGWWCFTTMMMSLDPSHKASAEHYGIYFETLPRRVLIMGVLANHTPPDPTQSSTCCTPALVYCAGTRRDPLYHDNPSYDTYKTPQQIAERIQADLTEEERIRSLSQPRATPKYDLILTLQLVFKDNGLCAVEGHNVAGDLMCKMNVSQQMMLRDLRGHVQRDADPNSAHNILLCLPNGQLLTEEHDMSVLHSWSDAAGLDKTGKAATDSKSCCSGCSVSWADDRWL